MLLIDLPSGKRIGIAFRHTKYDKPHLNTEICKRLISGITYCEVYVIEGSDAKLSVTGWGLDKWPDPFCKAIGRKQSLTSALRTTEKVQNRDVRVFSRDDREAIWKAYWFSISPQEPPTSEEVVDATLIQPESKLDVLGNQTIEP